MTTVLIVLGIVALVARILGGKREADRVVDTLLAIEARETERRRQAGIDSGFTAGWHGGGDRR